MISVKNKELKILVNKVIQLKTKNTPYNTLYRVTLANAQNLSEVRKIKHLLQFIITWEKYRSKKVTQCYHCQNFGHGMRNCSNSSHCVKCLEPHLTEDCTKSREETPRCVNCQGKHPVNYSKCLAFIKFVDKKSSLQQQQTVKAPAKHQ